MNANRRKFLGMIASACVVAPAAVSNVAAAPAAALPKAISPIASPMVVLDESGYWSDMIFDISSAYTGSSYSVYWRDRAIAVGNAVGRAMVELRDRYGLPFDVGALHEAMSLDRISAFVDLGGLPEKPISENTVADLRAYLSALPQYRFGVPVGQQSLTCLEQHGYLAMQLARVMFERPMDTPIPLGTTPKFV